jgi:hypothetical protein
MSYIITANIDPDVHSWIKQEQMGSVTKNLSKIVNFYLREAMNHKRNETPQMIICQKHPEASYSNRLSECPLCAEERTKKDIETLDAFLISERGRITTLITEKMDSMNALVTEVNSLDSETTEGGKTDRLNKQIDAIADDIRELRQKLADLK